MMEYITKTFTCFYICIHWSACIGILIVFSTLSSIWRQCWYHIYVIYHIYKTLGFHCFRYNVPEKQIGFGNFFMVKCSFRMLTSMYLIIMIIMQISIFREMKKRGKVDIFIWSWPNRSQCFLGRKWQLITGLTIYLLHDVCVFVKPNE